MLDGNGSDRVLHIDTNATVSISELTVSNGYVWSNLSYEGGGGIYNRGNLTINQCAIVKNRAGQKNNGGGICNGGVLYVTNCVIADNINPKNSVIPVPGIVYGGNGGGIYSTNTVILSSCILSNNSSSAGCDEIEASFYGPIYGVNGGAIWSSGNCQIYNSLIVSNSAGKGGNGGGAYVGQNGGNGGGIYNAGILSIYNSTINGNKAGNGGRGQNYNFSGGWTGVSAMPAGIGGSGGGIYSIGSASVVNCTINSNITGKDDAVIDDYFYEPHVITWYTGAGSGGGVYSSGTCSVLNTIIANNEVNDSDKADLIGTNPVRFFSPPGTGPDVYGVFTSLGHNLVSITDTNGFGTNDDIVGTALLPIDPGLDALGNNGGFTATEALESISPAINAGDDAVLSAPYNLTLDQRGNARLFGSHVDIGAFEYSQLENAFVLNIITNGLGSVTVSPASSQYTDGETVTVTATPSAGESFIGWAGNCCSTNAAITLKMEHNTVLTAGFSSPLYLNVNKATNGVGANLNYRGGFGWRYNIETSTDLTHWQVLTTVTNSFGKFGGINVGTDGLGTNASVFYRAVKAQ